MGITERQLLKRLRKDRFLPPVGSILSFGEKAYRVEDIFQMAISGVTGSRVALAEAYAAAKFGLDDLEFAIAILQFEIDSLDDIDPRIVSMLERLRSQKR